MTPPPSAPATPAMAGAPPPRFLLDHMLGTLAKWLRFLGYDAAYPQPALDDTAVLGLAIDGGRLLLTRDRDLARRAGARAFYVASDDPDTQFTDVVRRFGLQRSEAGTLRRCGVCNTGLEEATPEQVADRVPPGVLDRHAAFWRCPSCGRVYWDGSHTDRILRRLEAVVPPVPGGSGGPAGP